MRVFNIRRNAHPLSLNEKSIGSRGQVVYGASNHKEGSIPVDDSDRLNTPHPIDHVKPNFGLCKPLWQPGDCQDSKAGKQDDMFDLSADTKAWILFLLLVHMASYSFF
jgi:hypothetical protein